MKRLKIIILAAIVIGLGWYFFKGYNYKVAFKIKQSPSVVYNNILIWNDNKPAKDSVVTTIEKKTSKQVIQHYKLGDTLLKINWNLKRLNDSTTKVIANITDLNAPILRNIAVLNPNSIFSKNSKQTIERFGKILAGFNKTYKLNTIVEDTIPSKFCAYVPLKSTTESKAQVMRNNIYKVMNYIKGNSIKLDGHPFLEITDWNQKNDSIAFNFCFPIKQNDSLPATNTLQFKSIKSKEALKVVYNGNYRNSHVAWLTIKDYAEFNGINLDYKPLEIFLNDPHNGTNPLSWKADVYLPLKQ